MANDAALQQRRLKARFFYEYVDSQANIADLPSRGDWKLAARMLRDAFRVPVWWREMRLPPLTAV